MKKTLLYLSFLVFNLTNAQFIVSPNPFNVNSGTITVTYGSSGDYSLYDPQSNPNLYLYTGLETDGVASTWDYRDTWTDLNSLVPLTWNAIANAYVATFNIGTRNFTQVSSNSVMPVPAGTSVNNWYFIIRNGAGSSQSADLIGTNYGFTTALSNANFASNSIRLSVIDNKITTDAQGKIDIEIYTILGQKVTSYNIENYENLLQIQLNLNQKGIYIATIKNNNQTKSIKFNF